MRSVTIRTQTLIGSITILLLLPVLVAAATGEFRVSQDVRGIVSREEIREQIRGDEIIVKFKGEERFRRITIPRVQGISEEGVVQTYLARYRTRINVEYAEPNYIAYAFFTPNDPYYGYQWHLNGLKGDINTETAWDSATGAGAVVAVVDTGIAYENYRKSRFQRYYLAPDLSETCFVPGYDFVENDTHPNDDNSHGTHVAGTIAQSTNNGTGVAGVAFGACLMPIKVLNKNGSGTYADVAEGIRWAADHGANVINLSLGGSSGATYLEEALAYAYGKGVTIVAAAGNDSTDSVSYPAAYDDYVIAVGATRFDETRSSYSNYGASLDVVAPGGDTGVDQNGDGYVDGVLQNTFNPNTKNRSDFGYWFFQGTSMATPHVAGIAALLVGNGNAVTPDEVRSALEETAKDLGSTGWDLIYGHGLVDAAAALLWSAGPVDDPPVVSVTSPVQNAQVFGAVSISATASDDNGIERVDFYVDGALIATDTVSPYETLWDSTTVSDGAYAISATAFDTVSQSTSDSVAVVVENVNDAPTAKAGSDKSAVINELVLFDGSASFDPDGTIASYEWDFGDGATDSGSTVSHAYGAIGTYTVTLTVTDNDGASDDDTALVSVADIPETVSMHVGDITMTYEKRDRRWFSYCRVTAFVPVLDEFGNGVSDTVVSATWSGAYSNTVSETTNGNGIARFKTGWVYGCGTFTLSVSNLTKDGWTYDQGENIETSESVTP